MEATLKLAFLLLLSPGPSQDAAEKIWDTEYDKDFAPVVRAYEAAERRMRGDPADALRRLEEQVLPRLPRHYEKRLIVTYSGINKGEERERHDFYPWRLAGQCALAADLPEKAVEYLKKSPSSAALLARAEEALAKKKTPPPPTPPPLEKPRLDLSAFLDRHDYAGALKALEDNRAALGGDFDARVREVRRAAGDHVAVQTAALSVVLPRLLEEDFFKDHLDPCLKACRSVPADLETPELKWARRLAEWFKKRDREEFDRLALEAAKFDDKYHTVCRRAQEERIGMIEGLVDRAQEASRADRAPLLAEINAAERAFQALAAAKEYKDLRSSLAAARARIPVDAEAIDRARAGVESIKDIRVMADQLDGLWNSPTRNRLSVRDRNDLALHLGLYRSLSLFMEGHTIERVAADLRVIEVFGFSGAPLPPGVSPKVGRVYELVRKSR